jgi:uncharacterized protein (TIGR02145 family)
MKTKSIKTLLFVTSVALCFVGCKNDEPDPDQSAELVGTWEAVSFVATGCSDPTNNYNETCTNACEILVATATGISFDGDGPYAYTTKGNLLTVNLNGDKIVVTYSITGETLMFTFQDSPANGGCKNVSTYKKGLTDIDGNIYHTIKIGSQVWMVENLNVTKYRNGDPISNLTDGTQWKNTNTGAYCDYDNNGFNASSYGRLYNWHAVNDSRKIAPEGWHVASDAEWTTLTNYLGGEVVAGGKMKEVGFDFWQSPNAGATNESGFTALPGGTRYFDGAFDNNSRLAYWWTSTGDPGGAWYRYVIWEDAKVHRFGHLLGSGFSVRCVMD